MGSVGREHMTEKDWEAKFELLMSEDLIDLPLHLREEKLYFDDPNQMDEIFKELEERNLYLIHRTQEIEQALESQIYQQRDLESKLGRDRDIHYQNKISLAERIQNSANNVHELQKHSQMNMVAAAA